MIKCIAKDAKDLVYTQFKHSKTLKPEKDSEKLQKSYTNTTKDLMRETTQDDASATIFKNDDNENVYGSILNFDQ